MALNELIRDAVFALRESANETEAVHRLAVRKELPAAETAPLMDIARHRRAPTDQLEAAATPLAVRVATMIPVRPGNPA